MAVRLAAVRGGRRRDPAHCRRGQGDDALFACPRPGFDCAPVRPETAHELTVGQQPWQNYRSPCRCRAGRLCRTPPSCSREGWGGGPNRSLYELPQAGFSRDRRATGRPGGGSSPHQPARPMGSALGTVSPEEALAGTRSCVASAGSARAGDRAAQTPLLRKDRWLGLDPSLAAPRRIRVGPVSSARCAPAGYRRVAARRESGFQVPLSSAIVARTGRGSGVAQTCRCGSSTREDDGEFLDADAPVRLCTDAGRRAG